MTKIYKLLLALFIVLLMLPSCGPVHMFTRVKKIPREYSFNYCGDDIKAPKTDLNKEPWIVFSDQEKNQTYNTAGGKVKVKDIDYLDSFLVIGKKGEYLQLIKYSPDILKNGKLDYKKAEYYGWVHRSKLLLNQQSVTDIPSGKKNKMLVILADTTWINNPQKYFVTDSIKTFKDLDMLTQTGVALPYSIVYQLKQSENNKMTLISKKPYIKAEEVKDEVLGWVDNSLIRNIGTGLHINTPTLPQNSLQFMINKTEEISLSEDDIDISYLLSEQNKTIKFNPVSSYSTKDTLVAFKTRIVLPLFDYRSNYIFNVDGGHISHKEYRSIAKELKNINISFVFEGKEQTIAQFPQLVNALQNLQTLFEESEESFNFQFNCIMTFDDSNKLMKPFCTEFTSDYSQVINYLSEKANKKDKLRPIKLPRTWSGLRKAVDMFDTRKDATNLIILIGETGYTNDETDSYSSLANKLIENNCRILGFQVYTGNDNSYNNFVLDIENLISAYAKGMLKSKKSILVSPEQVRRFNEYKEIEDAKNSYRLDFPDNSITQGFLLFPPKGETLPMEVLTNNIDTIIQQIKVDNNSVINYMSKAFSSVGNNRTLFDTLFVRNFDLDTTRIPPKKLIASFENENPGWYLPSKAVILNDSVNNTLDYKLMLSESELKELKEFVKALSEKEVEYIYQIREKATVKRKPCDCPEDDLFAEIERANTPSILIDTTAYREQFYSKATPLGAYANTKSVRNHLSNVYLSTMKYCKLCKEKGSQLKSITLAEAQYRITGSPTANEVLNFFSIKDLKNKRIVSDKQLDDLINYFKSKKEELEKADKFESNGQTYYWLDRKNLP